MPTPGNDDQLRLWNQTGHLVVVCQGRHPIVLAAQDHDGACQGPKDIGAVLSFDAVLPDEGLRAESLRHGPNPRNNPLIRDMGRIEVGGQEAIAETVEPAGRKSRLVECMPTSQSLRRIGAKGRIEEGETRDPVMGKAGDLLSHISPQGEPGERKARRCVGQYALG